MYRHFEHRRSVRLLACTAMAAALVAGFATTGELALASSAQISSKEERLLDKAVKKAEMVVEKSPRDAQARATLASAYLAAGRFESAVSTFRDAQQLGDTSPRSALSLALAYIASGQNKSAVSVLDEWRDVIPAGDFGLALALAGDTGRGVAVLSDALRDGEDTPKLRQNLAYAYALDGRWREARVMAAQDVPADQLDARISSWARSGREDDYRLRVASMLHVPMRSDAGQPAHLALEAASSPALAVSAPVASTDSELPPVESGESFWLAEAARPEEPVVAVNEPAAPRAFEQAFAGNAVAASQSRISFVSNPVVQQVPVRSAAVEPPQVRASRKVSSAHGLVETHQVASGVAVRPADPEECTHRVQLGSFSNAENADRAWRIFVSRNPELKNFDKMITKAKVGGKIYYRVAAAGFDKRNAMTLCSAVKGKGYGCIAYAESRPLPGVISDGTSGGAARARR